MKRQLLSSLLRPMLIIFMLFSAAAPLFLTAQEQPIPAQEREALIALFNSLNGDEWWDIYDWKKEPWGPEFNDPGTEHTWGGVLVENGHVVELELGNVEAMGTLPPEIGNLTYVRRLGFHFNSVYGPLPSTIGNLVHLRELDFGANMLEGSIPPELGQCTALQHINFSWNFLSGPIPAELGQLVNLETLYLGIGFTGPIPAELGNLVKLRDLTIYGEMTGKIPASLVNLRDLECLDLEGAFTGKIPEGLGNLSKLRYLNLIGQMTGKFPEEISTLTQLEHLRLMGNLKGKIPPELGNLVKLTLLMLGGNELSGRIPPELGNLPELQRLELYNNHLRGEIPWELGSLEKMAYLQLQGNRLRGEIPASLMDVPYLRPSWFNLSHNAFFTTDPAVKDFMDEKHGSGWEQYQTVAPVDVTAESTVAGTVRVQWAPLADHPAVDAYRVFYRWSRCGPFHEYGIAEGNDASFLEVTGLKAGKSYDFKVQSVKRPHGDNSNTVYSGKSERASAVVL